MILDVDGVMTEPKLVLVLVKKGLWNLIWPKLVQHRIGFGLNVPAVIVQDIRSVIKGRMNVLTVFLILTERIVKDAR